MTAFTIYHGNANLNDLEACEEAAPSATHGCQQTPDWRVPSADPWILDNGAFVAYQKDEKWSYFDWMDAIDNVKRNDVPEPEWAVLPDVVGNAQATFDRTERFLGYVRQTGYGMYLAVQDGMQTEPAVRWAVERDFDGIFVGGTKEWKRERADRFVMTAHDYGLDCHIARPSDLWWAYSIGADSVDTTSIVRNQAWDRLRRFENKVSGQTELV